MAGDVLCSENVLFSLISPGENSVTVHFVKVPIWRLSSSPLKPNQFPVLPLFWSSPAGLKQRTVCVKVQIRLEELPQVFIFLLAAV